MNKLIIYLSIILIIPLIGCAKSVKLKFESMGSEIKTDENRTTIHSLAENLIEFDIHYAGVSPASARGILIDPKNDDKRLVPEGDDGEKVEDRETMNYLLKWNAGEFDYAGRLMRVVHPKVNFLDIYI